MSSMEQALRPHRGGTVLALGIVSLVAVFLFIPLGIVAWIMGSRDLGGMKRNEVDPSGRTLTQIGWVFGIAACVLWLGSAACAAMVFSMGPIKSPMMYASDSDHPGVRTVETHWENERHSYDDSNRRATWREVQLPDGEWVKEGLYVHRAPDGMKTEEGTYRAGHREGQWTFWNADGSIDYEQSGIYENDVLVQRRATPPGDYDIDDSPR